MSDVAPGLGSARLLSLYCYPTDLGALSVCVTCKYQWTQSAWAFFNRKPQTEPNRTEPSRSVGFFGFRFAARFLVLHCSVFGFGFGFILKPNRLTEQPMYNSVARKSRAHSREHTLRHSPDPSPAAHHGPSGHQAILANPTPHPAILSRQQRARGSQAVSRLAAAATAVAAPTPARLRFHLPLLPPCPALR